LPLARRVVFGDFMSLFRTTRRVEFHQTDAAGILHFSQFFLWMEQAEHEFLRHLGWSVVARVDDRTISWPRVASSCEFLRPLRFEEVIEIQLGVLQLRRRSLTYQSTFVLDEQLVARGTMTAVCCQIDTLGKFESTAIPESLRSLLENYQLKAPAQPEPSGG
jgi:acyl-CoA thioester hydrolase